MSELETIHGPLTTANAAEVIAAWEWYFTRRGPAPLDEEVNSSAHEMAKLSHVVLGELQKRREQAIEFEEDLKWYEDEAAEWEREAIKWESLYDEARSEVERRYYQIRELEEENAELRMAMEAAAE